jgi:hypothetical protein
VPLFNAKRGLLFSCLQHLAARLAIFGLPSPRVAQLEHRHHHLKSLDLYMLWVISASPSSTAKLISAMAGDDLSDDYVAKLLKEDAKKASQNYALGLGFLPKRYEPTLTHNSILALILLQGDQQRTEA